MIQEDKHLVLKDLCARLPYGVILNCAGDIGEKLKTIDDNGLINNDWDIDEVKPYLRPLSSMTEDEQKEFVKFHCVNICPVVITEKLTISNETQMFDWLNKKMFDYRGLIPKGCAIAVTKENNSYNDIKD